ncbi:MAG: hypothetical protein IT293_07250 [Deltaproteobacteria bacterium]|nr:hypothetical protein [Deltaproteobacteria bacterium]
MTAALERPLESCESVIAWAEGLRGQWGGDPLGEDPQKLATLAAFCELVGMDADALVAFCFLRKRATGERFASARRRDEILARLKEFESAAGRGVEARRRRSHVVSFLSHNGVLIY